MKNTNKKKNVVRLFIVCVESIFFLSTLKLTQLDAIFISGLSINYLIQLMGDGSRKSLNHEKYHPVIFNFKKNHS